MKPVIHRKKIKDDAYHLFIIIIYLFVFQNMLQSKIAALKYFDEFFAMCAVPVFLYRLVKQCARANLCERIIVVGILVTVLCGIISAAVYQYQELKMVAMDLLLLLKFFLVMYVGKAIFGRVLIIPDERKSALFHIKLMVLLFSLLTICDYIFKIYETSTRYNIRVLKLFYSHPSVLVATMVLIASLYIAMAQDKLAFKWLIPALAMMCLSLRSKGFGIAVAIVLMYVVICRGESQMKWWHVLLGAAVLWLVAKDQIDYYYGGNTEGYARAELQTTAFKIAKDYFPIGTGFGTYASYPSGVEYSPVYSMYGLSNIWGLTMDKTSFMYDTFWPMIIGQFGLLGTVGYGSAIVSLCYSIQKLHKKNKYIYFSSLTAIVYLLISSTSESAFVNSLAPPLGLIIGMGLAQNTYSEKL